MRLSVDRTIRFLSKYFPYPTPATNDSFEFWKSRLLYILILGFAFFGSLAYFPSIWLAFKVKFWSVIILDTVIYGICIWLALSKRLSIKAKKWIVLYSIFLLGVMLLLLLGPYGAGYMWLFLFPVLTGMFFRIKTVFYANLIILFTLIGLIVPIQFLPNKPFLIADYSLDAWIINSTNFISINLFASYSLAFILNQLNKSLNKEKRLTSLLIQKQKKLTIEKEKAQDADKLKSAFLANMSHEIRTPMNAIIGFSSIIGEPEIEKDKAHFFLELVQNAGEQLMRIIDDIIDISKIESRQLKIHIESINVNKTLDEIFEQFKTNSKQYSKDEIEFKLRKPAKNVDYIISSDDIRLKQILTNLLSNAFKFTKKGVVEFGFDEIEHKNKSVLRFYVRDTGIGIPKAELCHIFNRFIRVSEDINIEGTGLGLSISKGLLDLLGGEIWVESKFGLGSVFYFTLPLDNSVTCEDMPSKISADLPDLTEKLIYIAEDDLPSFYYLSELLQNINASVKHAVNGIELISMCREKLPDVIFLDLNMPEMDGLTALEEIRKISGKIPVFAQTAYAMSDDKYKVLEAGCDGYIPKPINRDELYNLLRNI